MNNPDYLVIPFSMFLDKKLKDIDCKIYGIVYWLNGLESGVRTANKTIANILNCSIKSVESSLSRLSCENCIKIDYKDSSKRHRILITPLVRMRKTQTLHSKGLDPSFQGERSITSSSSLNTKEREEVHRQAVQLLDYFKKQYVPKISGGDKPIMGNYGRWIKQSKSFLKDLGLKRMKELVDLYFDKDDKFLKENVWSINCFLTSHMINKLHQTNK